MEVKHIQINTSPRPKNYSVSGVLVVQLHHSDEDRRYCNYFIIEGTYYYNSNMKIYNGQDYLKIGKVEITAKELNCSLITLYGVITPLEPLFSNTYDNYNTYNN